MTKIVINKFTLFFRKLSAKRHLVQEFLFCLLVYLFVLTPLPVLARSQVSVICDKAAETASKQTGVPLSVLRAISLTETGRKSGGSFEPWPWTVNMEGKGVWFNNRGDAQRYVDENFTRGARSFDVGCFQLNYKWHGKAFASLEEMFDPVANAVYAANFLLDLFVEKGNWSEAAGAYHSRTPKYAQKYIRRFDNIVANLSDAPLPSSPVEPPSVQATLRVNRFPLLQGGNTNRASLGSLMPASAGLGASRLFGGG